MVCNWFPKQLRQLDLLAYVPGTNALLLDGYNMLFMSLLRSKVKMVFFPQWQPEKDHSKAFYKLSFIFLFQFLIIPHYTFSDSDWMAFPVYPNTAYSLPSLCPIFSNFTHSSKINSSLIFLIRRYLKFIYFFS